MAVEFHCTTRPGPGLDSGRGRHLSTSVTGHQAEIPWSNRRHRRSRAWPSKPYPDTGTRISITNHSWRNGSVLTFDTFANNWLTSMVDAAGTETGRSCVSPGCGACLFSAGMARSLRVQYPGAIYHLM